MRHEGKVPDPGAEPQGYLVEVGSAERIHFLDWGGPPTDGREIDRPAGVLLIHGLAQTAWAWAPVARRTCRLLPTVAVDLRGHGLSDAPTTGYERETLTADVFAAAEASRLIPPDADARRPSGVPGEARVILAGHGFGAIVAAWAAARLGPWCSGLVLVDGGWQDVREATGLEPGEWLQGLDEPPEILRSMAAYLADRAGFDAGSWDADQERAARAAVVEVPAGRVVPATRPHALAGSVEAMFAYRPGRVLPLVDAPIVALAAADDEAGSSGLALATAQAALVAAGRPPMLVRAFPANGHNLMRYRPDDVSAAILSLALARKEPGGPSTIAP